ncbi:MAG: NAD(P)H-binding protein [Pseudomonadota bacterium]
MMDTEASNKTAAKRVLLLGASGTIGAATATALSAAGHKVSCFVRPGSDQMFPDGVEVRFGQATDGASLREIGFGDSCFDTVVSCLASRSGVPTDAWAVDHDANMSALRLGQERGVDHMILLSAICVQKPMLAFQHAKRAFEDALSASGIGFSIIRPTAFFKSLSGQVERVRSGKPYLLFGDGRLTACRPISDRDLAVFIARAVTDPAMRDRVLPIGGPGPAITPLDQGSYLFARLGQTPRFRRVPVRMLDVISGGLSLGGQIVPRLREKAELARIGRYYATESMLHWDEATGQYDADATPAFGQDRLFDYYDALLDGRATDDRGAHAVF